MPQFSKHHIFILPHAEEHRQRYNVSVEDILLILNEPEVREGLATDHYTAMRTIAGYLVYLDYYVTLPLQGDGNEAFAIIDYMGYEPVERLPN